MADEYKREKEQFAEYIAALRAECNGKDKETTFLKETLSGKEKEIAYLKEKLSHVQQHGKTKEFDFGKQMATIDEELRKAKKSETLVENKTAEVEDLHSELQTFNAADYFDLQPSWFDTLLNNVGCLEIKNNPVTARDLEANKTDGSNSKLAETVKDRPPRTPVENLDGTGKGIESNKIGGCFSQLQRINSFSEKAKRLDQPPRFPVASFGRAEVEKSTPPVHMNDVTSNKTTESSGGKVNPFSKKARALDRPPQFPVGNFGRAEVERSQLKDVASNKITDSSGNKVNPFSKRAKGGSRPSHVPGANVVEAQAVKSSPPKDVKVKNTDCPSEINPFCKKAKGSAYCHHRPLQFIPATNVLNGSPMAPTYQQASQSAHTNVKPFPQTEQSFLSRTFNKWFGSY